MIDTDEKEYEAKLTLEKLISSDNIAVDLTEEVLKEIGKDLVEGIVDDDKSREGWVKQAEDWLELASMIQDEKSWPWADAANIKYPILAIASTQFAARAYAALLPGDQYVRIQGKGFDKTGEKNKRALRISKHMSWQLKHEMKDWEKEMDRLLHILPITGVAFKKTYFNTHKGHNVSELVHPLDLIINYNARSLDDAERKTHIQYYTHNDLEEYTRAKLFIRPEKKLTRTKTNSINGQRNHHGVAQKMTRTKASSDHQCFECHTWLDLDGDGYKEPYIVTIHSTTEQVLRIKARFDFEDVEVDEDETVVRILPKQHFTSWTFIPDFNSSVYGLGFGHLLGSLNDAVNTLANQLIDAGTLSNLQGGYMGANMATEGGDEPFQPGEWRIVNIFGDDIRKSIVPLPVREPSGVLFNLLSLLENSAMKMASVTDIMTGDIPGQNTKTGVAMAAIEQGSKVFSSIYKRCHTATTEEFKKLFDLNYEYLDPETYVAVLDDSEDAKPHLGPQDYDGSSFDVYPVSDPTISSEQQRLMKVQAIEGLLNLGLNQEEYKKRFLEATEQPNVEALLEPNPTQGPPPEEVRADKELEWKLQKEQMEIQELVREKQHKRSMDILDRKLKAMEVDIKDDAARTKSILELTKAAQAESELQFETSMKTVEDMRNNQLHGLDVVQRMKDIQQPQDDSGDDTGENSPK